MITVENLTKYYLDYKLSSSQIADKLKCSISGVNYWLAKYNIPKRSISDAVYFKCNPTGDPFSINRPLNIEEGILYGLGLGLYWGEGNKRNTNSLRLANTDPKLVKKYIEFLTKIYEIRQNKLKFGLQIFGDINGEESLGFWVKYLGVKKSQFQKVVYIKKRGGGTYKHSAKYGVLIVYFNNKKLRDIICGAIEKL